ncbi:PTS fructose transporter subunit IIC, partial [Bacillus cereus]|nr:PTS fructose transporter subunit IIC [Bacillus cereus]
VRVIVSCVVGSSIAGALSMLFQITLPAPHGGLFVIALVNKPVLYIFSILIGAVVSALMMGIWKKEVK